MIRNVGTCRIETVQGDITLEKTDAIGNAANSMLAGGGGVDGAIHRAGGPAIMAECRRIGGCPTGGCVVTTAGRLKAKRVLHMVGPIWNGGENDEAELLAFCYRSALDLAVEHGLRSVAFPSVSTGIYGFPVRPAAMIALRTIAAFLRERSAPELVRMVLFDPGTRKAYDEGLAELLPDIAADA
ncbi:MAG: O-acetyl-ADP-ribose deacetylase [Planctomycetota bacterium]|nr:O-acetyl-ADP-ribose deacetylase [Planctomycetota bacterium]